MAIKDIISFGIGFAPGSVSFMPTIGFSMGGGPTPGTGEYLERFDVFGARSGRMNITGAKSPRMIVYGGDSEPNQWQR